MEYNVFLLQASPRNGALPDLLPKTPETRRSFADPHAEEEEEVRFLSSIFGLVSLELVIFDN